MRKQKAAWRAAHPKVADIGRPSQADS
jgi:hypothetical protein